MFFALLWLYFIYTEVGASDVHSTNDSDFVGANFWSDDSLKLCDTSDSANSGGLACHVFVRNYQFINVDVLSEDPILFIYRGFAPAGYVEDFLEDVHVRRLTEQVVVKDGEENVTELSEVRRANGTWIPHTASYGAERMYERAVALLPFINFESSEPWQVLSYLPGGHYAPHNDYIEFASPAHYDGWTKRYGNRMATFFLLLQGAKRGGELVFSLEYINQNNFGCSVRYTVFLLHSLWSDRNTKSDIAVDFDPKVFITNTFTKAEGTLKISRTVFPELHLAAHPSVGDAVFWANVDHTGAMESNSLHGGCPVYEGEKIAAVLWIRMKGQSMFRSASNRLNLRELMERGYS